MEGILVIVSLLFFGGILMLWPRQPYEEPDGEGPLFGDQDAPPDP